MSVEGADAEGEKSVCEGKAEVLLSPKSVCEGKAEVLLPPNVFYNPVQEFNRDLTIAVISKFSLDSWKKKKENGKFLKPDTLLESDESETTTGYVACDGHTSGSIVPVCTDATSSEEKMDVMDLKSESEETRNLPEPGKRCVDGIRILEGLAASGLRSVRFALEIPGIKEVVANDFDRVAFSYIKQNAQINHVEEIVMPSYMDAAMLMYQSRKFSEQFDVIDLDPYGSPSLFLDAAVQSVRAGGLLCVTCTDMAILCGNATETCHAKYGSTSLRAKFCHEMAVRILLRSIESHANRYSRFIVPLLSISVDFYCRVFVRVFSGQKKVKDSAAKLAMVYHCNSCGSFALQPLVVKTTTQTDNIKYAVSTGPPVGPRCEHCNGRYNLGGPIWSAPIHDKSFVQDVVASIEKDSDRFGTRQRILGVLNVVCEELEDQPLYYDMDHLCNVLHCTAVGFLPMRSALLHRGYAVSLSHASKKSLKTNAPSEVIWDIMRCWVKKYPVNAYRLQKGSTAERILSREASFEADFSTHPDANPKSRQKGLVRWQLNPDKDWGPKPRAARSREAVEERKLVKDLKCQERKSKRKAENEENLQATMKEYPCKRLREGLCSLGGDCRYSHREDSENQGEMSSGNLKENSEQQPLSTEDTVD